MRYVKTKNKYVWNKKIQQEHQLNESERKKQILSIFF